MTPLDIVRAECYAAEAAASAALADGGSMEQRQEDEWQWAGDRWEYRQGDRIVELVPPTESGCQWSAYLVFDTTDFPPDTEFAAHEKTAEGAMRGLPAHYAIARDALGSLPSKSKLRESAIACICGEAAGALAEMCNDAATARGWWDIPREVGTLLMLAVSELAEAMEAHRKGLQDQHLPHRPGIEVELADALIRICDMAGGLGLDIGGAVRDKLMYNASRADHDPAVRAQAGGKAY